MAAERTMTTRKTFVIATAVFVAIAGVLVACDQQPDAHAAAQPNTKTPTPQQPTPAPAPAPTPAPAPAQPSGQPATDKPNTDKPSTDKPSTEKPTDAPKPANPIGSLKTTNVKIAGRTFKLEIAATDEQRFKGLTGRTEIAADGGMIFVFVKSSEHQFVMRDCPIPIDIIYLDGAGRVVSFHKMVPETPRSETEKGNLPPVNPRTGTPIPNVPEWAWTNADYEQRLKKYPSGFASQFVVELRGNMLDELKIKKGDKFEFDAAGLKKQAK